MHAWLRRLIEPAKTSPADDSFRWNDKRSKREQALSGVRIVGGLIAGLLVVTIAFGSLTVLSDNQQPQSGRSILLSSTALVATALIMFFTAHRWAPFVTGFVFGPVIPKVLGILAVGNDSYYSAHSITQTDMVELLVYALAVVALTFRFLGKRPAMTTIFDRIALTSFVFVTFRQVLVPYRFPPWWMLAGLAALFVAWCASRRLGAETTRKRQRLKRS